MAATTRPRRSVLYVPGSNARALEKARTVPADALILDLEDAVTPEAKKDARRQVVEALAAGGYGKREILVRVNGLDSEWGHDDVSAVAAAGADAVLLPKVESAEAVRELEAFLVACDAPAEMAIWCMIETPLGVLHAEEIAWSSQRLGGFVMGTSDLAKDLHCLHTPDRLPFVTSLSLCVLAARAYDLGILDGVHLDLHDDEGFAGACRQGLALGFDGKTLIHPRTIETANTIFAPSVDELQWSERIIAAHAEATKKGKGVVVVDGRLVETLHVEDAQRLLKLAAMITELESSAG